MQTVTQGCLQTSGGLTLPLESTEITGGVRGPVAELQVIQVFRNSTEEPVDATYLFPLPHQASVYRMRFEVGSRVVHARLKERLVAWADYERARSEGRRAALLEQERPNLFTMQVAAIRPGESVRVVLGYQQQVEFDDGSYQLVFPLVCADRHVTAEEVPDVERIRARRLKACQRASDVSVRLELPPGVKSVTHDITCQGGVVELAAGDRLPNRDLVLQWPGCAGVAWHRPEGQPGTFLVSVVPPANAAEGPRDVVVLFDRSCSMQGQTTEQARRAVDYVLASLGTGDRFQLLAFDHEVTRFSEDFVRPPQGPAARSWLRDQAPRGGTDLGYALQQLPPTGEVLLITDATVANEEELARRLGGRRLYVLGVGAAVNRYLVSRLARCGGGAAEVLTPFADPTPALERMVRRLRAGGPFASGLEVAWEGVQPTDARLSATTFYGGQPVTVSGRFTQAGPARLVLTGTDGFRFEQDLHLPEVAEDFPALEREWARRCLDTEVCEQGKLALALRYSLLCDLTAFVAEDDEAMLGTATPVEFVGAEVAGSPMDARKKRHVAASAVPSADYRDKLEEIRERRKSAPVELCNLGRRDTEEAILKSLSRRPVGCSDMVLECRSSSAPRRPESVVCLSMMTPPAARPPQPPPPALPADPYADCELGTELDGSLDLVFLMDETGSMGGSIAEVQAHVLQIIADVQALPLCRQVRVGLVRYRDHPPQDQTFVTKVHALTADVRAIKAAVSEMHADGGGDGPEAVTDGLYELCGLNWRPGSVRTVVWIGDAPPHGVERSGDGFPDGCPCGRHWYAQAESCREMGIVVHAVGARATPAASEVFKLVARTTRGLALEVAHMPQLASVITGLAASDLDKLRLQRRVEEVLAQHDLSSLSEQADRIEFVTALLHAERVRRLDPNSLALRFRQLEAGDVEEALHRLELAAR